MGHVVRYRSAGGDERLEDVDSLDAAVGRVENLRNIEGVSEVRVYREVPLEFRTYVRVAVADVNSAAPVNAVAPADPPAGGVPPSGAAVIPPPPTAAVPAPSEEVSEDADDVDPSADSRRISLFNRGQAS